MVALVRLTQTVFLALFAVACTANAKAASAWLPAGLQNVAPASRFVAGPSSMDWYHHDEPETVHFVSNRYFGDIGYAAIVHLSCDEDSKNNIFTPGGAPEVGTCVLGSTIEFYEVSPGIGGDAFTGTCYMRDASSCGTPECSDAELHISGTAFLVKNAYALDNPNVGANEDPNCQDVNDRLAGGRAPRRRKHRQHGQDKARDSGNSTSASVASLNSRYGSKHREVPATLPANVWVCYSYIYKGYFKAVNMKEMRSVGQGSFELVWPIDFLGAWDEVSSNTLPKDALFIKRPYTATISYWDNHKESKSGYRGADERE